MELKKKAFLLLAATILTRLASTIVADEGGGSASKKGETNTTFNMYGNFGTAILTDLETGEQKIYYKLSLQPELTIGKFGFGLNLEFYFDENSNLRKDDWTWSKTIEKIWYVRYGRKYEPVYAYLGGFKDVTLGHGLIVSHYTNMLRYPDIKKIGFEFDTDFGAYGFESFLSNLTHAEVYGGRAYWRPFYNSYLPLLPKLGIGLTCVNDQDPDARRSTTGDQVTVFGFDVDVPVLEHYVISILSYIDFAQINLGASYSNSLNDGRGWALGFMGGMLKGVSYRAELRRLDYNFVPAYFNSFYEIDRHEKAEKIPGTRVPAKIGPYIELMYDLAGKVSICSSFEAYNHDPTGIYPHFRGCIFICPQLLLNKVSILISYDKRNVDMWRDLVKVRGNNTIITTEIGYHVDPHLALFIIHKQTFDAFGRPAKRTVMECRVQF